MRTYPQFGGISVETSRNTKRKKSLKERSIKESIKKKIGSLLYQISGLLLKDIDNV